MLSLITNVAVMDDVICFLLQIVINSFVGGKFKCGEDISYY